MKKTSRDRARRGGAVPHRPAAAAKPEKTLKQHLHEGLAAALKADPDMLRNGRPRTVLGEIVRQLAIRAMSGQCDAIKLVAAFLDISAEEGWNKTETQSREQGNSKAPTRWDWSESGEWNSPQQGTSTATGQGDAGPRRPWEELYDRILRAGEAERAEDARLAGLKSGTASVPGGSGNFAKPEFPASGNFSGNFPGNEANPQRPLTVRIAGKEV